MKTHERAIQIHQILTSVAHNRQVPNYDIKYRLGRSTETDDE